MEFEARETRVIDFYTLKMLKNGILYIHLKSDRVIDMAIYRKVIATIGEMTGGKKVPFLNVAEALTLPDDEVRAYMNRPDANPYCSASAIVTHSLAQKIIGNVYMKIISPIRPTRMFSNEQEAMDWLKGFL